MHDNINLINIIEKISRKSAKSALKMEKFNSISKELSILSDFLKISKIQAVLFSAIVELSLNRTADFDSIAEHYNCSQLKVIGMMDELEALVAKNLLTRERPSRNGPKSIDDVHFSVPYDIIEILQKKDNKKMVKDKNLDLPNFLEYIFNKSEARRRSRISTAQFILETEKLIKNNGSIPFVQYIDKLLKDSIDKAIIFILSYGYITDKGEIGVSQLTNRVFDNITPQFDFQQKIIQNEHPLIVKGLIEIQFNPIINEKEIIITDKLISNLTQNSNYQKIRNGNNSSGNNLIQPKNIKQRALFFNPVLQIEISTLQKTLADKKYKSIRSQLINRKFNSGLTILLYGPSGTGKTEVVYQLARKSGREIMMVDLSDTKSKWFGDSEKKVKKIFDDYRQAMKNCRRMPILFINEVDGLFSKRTSVSDDSTASSQSLNTMQNILLQEMEIFDGILFATTNLTENLDTAFDRRFLFKLGFSHPDEQSRQKIWKNRMTELSLSQSKELGNSYALTGAQIENIIRQTLLAQMVDGTVDLHDVLIKNCLLESGYSKRTKVGFVLNS